jgi:WD40 repeat protein
MDGSVSIWDVSKRQLSGDPFRGHTRPVFGLSFNEDDSFLASGSWDKTIVLWNVESRQQVGNPLRGHTDHVYSLAFSPDGKTLASGSWDNTILLWNMDMQSWIEKACAMAGRNFTRAEWGQYLSNKTYPTNEQETTCKQWLLEPQPTAVP